MFHTQQASSRTQVKGQKHHIFGKQYLSFIGILCSAVSKSDSKQRLKTNYGFNFSTRVRSLEAVGGTLRPSPAKMQDEEVKLKAAPLKLLHGSSMAQDPDLV